MKSLKQNRWLVPYLLAEATLALGLALVLANAGAGNRWLWWGLVGLFGVCSAVLFILAAWAARQTQGDVGHFNPKAPE